jgi:hypothetical protein
MQWETTNHANVTNDWKEDFCIRVNLRSSVVQNVASNNRICIVSFDFYLCDSAVNHLLNNPGYVITRDHHR